MFVLLREIMLYATANWAKGAKFWSKGRSFGSTGRRFGQMGEVLVRGSYACDALYPNLFRSFALYYTHIWAYLQVGSQ